MTLLAGRLLLVLGVLHMAVAMVLSWEQVPGWVRGDLRFAQAGPSMNESTGWFWMSLGSFAVPLLALGALIIACARRRQVVPASVGWGIGVWGLVSAAVLEPTPFLLLLVPATLIVLGARRPRANGVGAADEAARTTVSP